MNTILHSPWTERMGWALLHSLWEGALIWSVAAMFFSLGRKLSAARRHLVGWVAISLLALCPIVTIAWLTCEAGSSKNEAAPILSAPVSARVPQQGAEAGKPTAASPPVLSQEVLQRFEPASNSSPSFSLHALFPFLVIGWLMGVGLLSVRLALGWWWLARLRYRSSSIACLLYTSPSPRD